MTRPAHLQNDTCTHRSGPAPVVQAMMWVFVPVLKFTGMELAARRPRFSARWYTGIRTTAETSAIDVILLGSSRVPAAIDPVLFEKAVEDAQQRDVVVVMPARGGITLIGHTLGVRRLFTDYPANLRGCTVFLELPGGLPPMFGTWHDTLKGWRGVWAWEGRSPQLLVEVLSLKDLWLFWRSQTDLELKIQLTLRCLAKPLYLVRYREIIRDKIFSVGKQTMREEIVGRLFAIRNSEAGTDADLADRGGIRKDRKTVERARARMRRRGREMLEDQQPWRNWEDTALATLIETVQRNGGSIVFFEMPQSTVLAKPFETDIRRADRAHFRDWVASYGIHILKPEFTTSDDDFPDLLHLAKSKSPVFTEALVRAWLEAS